MGAFQLYFEKIQAGCFRKDRIKNSFTAVSQWQFTILKMKVVRPYLLTDRNLLWTRPDIKGNLYSSFLLNGVNIYGEEWSSEVIFALPLEPFSGREKKKQIFG